MDALLILYAALNLAAWLHLWNTEGQRCARFGHDRDWPEMEGCHHCGAFMPLPAEETP